MLRRLFNVLKLRKKLTVFVSFLLIFGLSATLVKNRFDYDAAYQPSLIEKLVDEHLIEEGLMASAPMQFQSLWGFGPYEERVPFVKDLNLNVRNSFVQLITDFEKALCMPDAENKVKSNPLPYTETNSKDNISCTTVVQRLGSTLVGESGQYNYTLNTVLTIGSTSLMRSSQYNNPLEENSAQLSTVKDTVSSSTNVTSKGSYGCLWDGVGTNGVKCWIPLAQDTTYNNNLPIYKIDGNAEFVFRQDLSGSENLLKHYLKYAPQDSLRLNFSGTNWTMSTSGYIDFKVKVAFDSSKDSSSSDSGSNLNTVTMLEPCPSGCKINFSERQSFNGSVSKVSGEGKISGNIVSYVNHSETYSGHMVYNDTSKTLKWADDLNIIKTDYRNQTYDLNRTDANNQTTQKWKWNKQTDSRAVLYPSRNKYDMRDRIISNLDLTSYFKGCNISSIDPANSENCTLEDQTSNKKLNIDKTETKSSPTFGELEFVSSASRFGNGSYEFTGPVKYAPRSELDVYYEKISGNFTVNEGGNEFTVTSAVKKIDPLVLPTGSGMIGTHFDPYTKFEPSVDYFNIYTPELEVPGKFTIKDGEYTAITGPKVKSLPSKIVIFESYPLNNKNEIPSWLTSKSSLEKTIAVMKKYNPSLVVTTFDTRSRFKMLSAIGNIPNGAWLINLGHGNAVGLGAGDTDFVSYSDLSTALYKNNVHLSVFAGETCYSARAPLADIVIGSVSVGWGTVYAQQLGELFGANGNPFTRTINNLQEALVEAYKSAIASNPTPWTPPWIQPDV